jgi:tetratricopeptide (TPR) repeat protein
MDAAQREALIAALGRLGRTDARARTLAVVQRGLSSRSELVDAEAWSGALGGGTYAAAPDASIVHARVENQDAVLKGVDAAAHLDLAESFLETAYAHYEQDPDYARLLFLDAGNTAREAEALGASGWRVDAALAIAAYYADEQAEAYARAEAAVTGDMPEAAPGWNAMAVLAIFAKSRQETIQQAVAEKIDWPPEWLTDVDAAYAVLAHHPFGTPEQVVAHYDFLNWLAAPDRSRVVLGRGLTRFPDAPELHERLLRHVLWERGVRGLEPAYAKLLAQPDAPAAYSFHAGRASVVTAEFRRRMGHDDLARSAYLRAIEYFEADAAADPAGPAEADRQIALVLAARARLAYEAGEVEGALTELLASFDRDPRAVVVLDGLSISPADTARMLRAGLDRAGHDELRDRLDAALRSLEELDPTLLDLPAYEQQLPPVPGGQGGG